MLVDTEKSERVDIPHESGQWVELRRLTWGEMDECRDVEQTKQFESVQQMGGDVFAAIVGGGPDNDSLMAQVRADKPSNYDTATMIQKALTGWSYPEPCNPQNQAKLDKATASWLATEIWNRNRELNDVERKND